MDFANKENATPLGAFKGKLSTMVTEDELEVQRLRVELEEAYSMAATYEAKLANAEEAVFRMQEAGLRKDGEFRAAQGEFDNQLEELTQRNFELQQELKHKANGLDSMAEIEAEWTKMEDETRALRIRSVELQRRVDKAAYELEKAAEVARLQTEQHDRHAGQLADKIASLELEVAALQVR